MAVHIVPAGIDLEEQAQLDLAIFLSLEEEKARAAADAACTSSAADEEAGHAAATNLMDASTFGDSLSADSSKPATQQSASPHLPRAAAPVSPFAEHILPGQQSSSSASSRQGQAWKQQAVSSSLPASPAAEASNSSHVRDTVGDHGAAVKAEQAELARAQNQLHTLTLRSPQDLQQASTAEASSIHSPPSHATVHRYLSPTSGADITHAMAPQAGGSSGDVSIPGGASTSNAAEGLPAVAARLESPSSDLSSPLHSASNAWDWLDQELHTNDVQLFTVPAGNSGIIAQVCSPCCCVWACLLDSAAS